MVFKIICIILFLSYLHSLCPPQCSLCGGICMNVSTKIQNLCNAWSICESIHGRLAKENEISAVDTCRPTNYVWVGLTDFLINRYMKKTGWLWSDGSVINKTSLWDSDEPDASLQHCVFSMASGLGSGSCNFLYPFICFYDDSPSQLTRVFVKSPAIYNIDSEFGCQETYIVENVMFCAIKCKFTYNCKSFYYEDFMKQCVIVKYFDSALPQSYNNGQYNWNRYN